MADSVKASDSKLDRFSVRPIKTLSECGESAMQARRLTINNFRGIRSAKLLLPQHAVLIGDNNVGKTTVLESLDLVLGPERLNRSPVVDEHDFFEGRYIARAAVAEPSKRDATREEAVLSAPDSTVLDDDGAIEISIEVVVIGLNDEQKAKFGDYAEWWDVEADQLYDEPSPEGVDRDHIVQALRVTFLGRYNEPEDDFEGQTYFSRSLHEDENPTRFGRGEKQICGFLYLRSLRTASRALSLERGSLLDIILRIKEIRPQMWEDTLETLGALKVANDEAHGISGVLESIDAALARYVPKEWGAKPHLRVSSLTRDHLRKVITAFISTGDGDHAAPFYRQGTGTINMLVLAMLSQIAEDKQNVIFAMEEPETAIPPYAQKRIVQEVRSLSSQAIFTSHSPYVLEEFSPDTTIVLQRSGDGTMRQAVIRLPESVKLKRYRQEFRTRFCEALLARRVLIAEGATEATAIPAAARKLAEEDSERFGSLEGLGICTVDAGSESNIADMASLYSSLGKRVFAVCDKQSPESEANISSKVEKLFMHEFKTIEKLVIDQGNADAFLRFADVIEWPPHILQKHPDPKAQYKEAFAAYFAGTKGNWGIAEFLAQCNESEMPPWVVETCQSIHKLVNPESAVEPREAEVASDGANAG